MVTFVKIKIKGHLVVQLNDADKLDGNCAFNNCIACNCNSPKMFQNINLNLGAKNKESPILRHFSSLVNDRVYCVTNNNNKSFTNPNFVNKQHPNVFTTPTIKTKSEMKQMVPATVLPTSKLNSVQPEQKGGKLRTRRRKRNSKKKTLKRDEEVKMRSEPIQMRSEPIQIAPTSKWQIVCNISSSSDTTNSCSPVICRLRLSSECESEDSFILFCDDATTTERQHCTDHDLSSIDDSDDDDFDFVTNKTTDFNQNNTNSTKKKVTFKNDSELCEIHPMVKWGHAYQQARIGPWEECARDRARFQTRCQNMETILAPVLQMEHRDRIHRERFSDSELVT